MIYEYECEIHKVFEEMRSMSDPPLEECPFCQKEGIKSNPPKRLISLCNFELKGGGWADSGYSSK